MGGKKSNAGRPKMNAAILKVGMSVKGQLDQAAKDGDWKKFDAISATFIRAACRAMDKAPILFKLDSGIVRIITDEIKLMRNYVTISDENSPEIEVKSGGNSPEIEAKSGDNPGQEARATKDGFRLGDNSQTPLPESPSMQELEDAFNDLWEVYPRKSGKGDAKRAFFRVVREEGVAPATIFYAVMEQSKSPDWTADDGKFVPSLTKWLDGGRWDDVLSAPQEKKMAAPPAQLDPYEYRGPRPPEEIWGGKKENGDE